MLNYFDVLKAQSGIPVDDIWAEIWGIAISDKYTVIEYTGSLPITITADGNALLDYRIYGVDGGVGVATENLFDKNAKDAENGYANGKVLRPDGTSPQVTGQEYYSTTEYIEIPNNATNLTLVKNSPLAVSGICFYDTNKEYISGMSNMTYGVPAIISCPTGAVYFRTVIAKQYINEAMVVPGSTAPTSYIPYGYKLPMTVQSANLFDKSSSDIMMGKGFYSDTFSILTVYINRFLSGYIKVKPNTTYICNSSFLVRIYTSDDDKASSRSRVVNSEIFKTNSDENFIMLDEYQTNINNLFIRELLEVPVYIGENQLDSVEGVSDYVDKSSGKIVRMIGEYTFTGDESFNKYGNSDVFYTSTTIDPVGITTVNTITMRCNHPAFTTIENKDTRYWLNPEADDICCFLPGGRSQVFLRSTSNFTTVAECQAYLKTQYDNGTPVKISYWLKTPIEEDPPVPLPDIPTIDGTTIIDYDGDPKPSQMYVKYKRRR